MIISDELLKEFKERMKISHDSEDDNLRQLLSFSVTDLINKCGDFSLEENEQAKELVFERSRYAYNDALEYFDTNFLSLVTQLGVSLALEKIDLEATAIDETV